jgi:phosphohistidine phosphatase SixA
MDHLSWGVMRHGDYSGGRLNKAGKVQVMSVGKQLLQLLDLPEDIHIYSSPVYRALDTAKLLANVLREVRPTLEDKGELAILECDAFRLTPESIVRYLRAETLVLFVTHKPDIENFLGLLHRDEPVKLAQLFLNDGSSIRYGA